MSSELQLIRDKSCLRDLSWDIKGAHDVDSVANRLEELAWKRQNIQDKLWIYRSADHDEVLIVARTARVQLRVSYMIQPDLRAARARELFALIFESEG